MLNGYLNQTAIFTPAVRVNGAPPAKDKFGVIEYGKPRNIKCRCETQAKDVVMPEGRTVRVEQTYYLGTEVMTGDLIDGAEVLFVHPWVSLGGKPIGWEAMV